MKSSFVFCVQHKNLTLSVSGEVRMKGESKTVQLTPHVIRDFLEKDCATLMLSWNYENLLKLRELVFRYIESTFKEFQVDNIVASWKNGEEYIDLGN